MFDPCKVDRYQRGIDTMFLKLIQQGNNYLWDKESIYKLLNLRYRNNLLDIEGRKIDKALVDKYLLDILLLKYFQSNNTHQLYNS